MSVIQQDLWGNKVVAGDVVDRIAHILEEHEDARDDYKVLMARYWMAFDGLDEFLGDLPAMRSGFLAWFVGLATSPKTLQNRCMEIQKRRPGLDAAAEVREERQRMARQGPVR